LTEQLEALMLSACLPRWNQRGSAQFELDGSVETGFTLIELMVVLLILAILLAIAIPTFLGTTGASNDRAAQSNLNTALTNAKTIFQQNNQVYPLWDSQTPTPNPLVEPLAQAIAANEPSLRMVVTATGPPNVSVAAAGKVATVTDVANPYGAIVFSLASNTQECWWIADNTTLMTTGTAAAAPWKLAAAFPTTSPGTETVAGVPVAQGTFYGVYKLTGSATCDSGTLGTTKSNVSTAAFPPPA
jgi:type IV pilus assembly protein PilA